MNQVCFRLTVKTNSVGQFRLSLPTGEFSVQVDVPSYVTMTKVIQVSAGETSRMTIKLSRDERVAGIPRMVFIVLVSSLALSVLTMILCCCSCYERRKNVKKQRTGTWGFHLLEQTDRQRMNPIIIDSHSDSSSDDELFSQQQPPRFKLKPSSSSAFRPIKPKGRVMGTRMGQYRDETSSSEEEINELSMSPSSFEEEALFMTKTSG